MKKLLIGGSPCTHWSIAQKNNRETTAEGIGWELFRNYLIAKEKFKPDYFLYENNKSAAQPIKDQIAKELGVWEGGLNPYTDVRFTYINSALVSAQNRQRFYVTNFGDIRQPEDRGILLRDILETGTCWKDKSHCIDANYFKATNGTDALIPGTWQVTMIAELADGTQKPIYEVRNGQITIKGKQYPIKLSDGYYIIRKLTVAECCRLQGMPDWWFDDENGNKIISNSQCYKGLGNGWQLDTVKYLMSHMPIDKDEEIVCLSMYDGIGTGRRILEELGFTNVKYIAYEIDKYCVKLTSYRYPDIVHMGDAFQVRSEGWLNQIYDKTRRM